jgi:exodeoxyribonuclease-3
MKIATFNVNGISARLSALLRWLAESKPDVARLQKLKAPQENFPEAAIREAGYGVIWHGQKSWNGVAILARGADPVESRRGLPGDPEDVHSRYIEALINGLRVRCLYLPNGNPAPGPKCDYKLRWLERLTKHAQELLATAEPVVLAGDYNVIPIDLMSTSQNAGLMMRSFCQRYEARSLILSQWAGPTRCVNYIRMSASTLFGITSEMPLSVMPACASIICF